MKKLLILVAFVALFATGFAQQVSSRAKAMRMMNVARNEYMVKDIKIIADTMIVYSLADPVVYPFGKFNTVEDFVLRSELQWYREVGYKQFFKGMEVSVNTVKRVDGSFIDVYRAINTGRVEILKGKLTDPEVLLLNGLHAGSTKQETFLVYFTKYLKAYAFDINVLKVISGAGEVSQIYSFAGNKLRHIQFASDYRYY